MSALVTIILTALQAVEALLGATGIASGTIDKVIALLVEIIPLVEKEAVTVIPYIKNIIAALQGNADVTTAQLSQLSALDAAADQAFEAAATNAQAQQ